MQHRDEEEARPIMRTISMRAIQALVPGVSSIDDYWIEYGGVRVTQVPAGEKFDIYCKYSARNEAGGTWKVCATVIGTNIADGIQNYQDTASIGNTKTETAHLNQMGNNIMPNKNISLRFKLWLHDDTAETHPPVEAW